MCLAGGIFLPSLNQSSSPHSCIAARLPSLSLSSFLPLFSERSTPLLTLARSQSPRCRPVVKTCLASFNTTYSSFSSSLRRPQVTSLPLCSPSVPPLFLFVLPPSAASYFSSYCVSFTTSVPLRPPTVGSKSLPLSSPSVSPPFLFAFPPSAASYFSSYCVSFTTTLPHRLPTVGSN